MFFFDWCKVSSGYMSVNLQIKNSPDLSVTIKADTDLKMLAVSIIIFSLKSQERFTCF